MIKTPRIRCILHGHHAALVETEPGGDWAVECLRCRWPIAVASCPTCGKSKTNIPEVDLKVHANCTIYAGYPTTHLRVVEVI